MTGAVIANEVAAALAEVGGEVGAGTLYAVLEKPGTPGGSNAAQTPGTPDRSGVLTVVEKWRRQRDAAGTLVGTVTHMLMANSTGPVPEIGDRVALGYTVAEVSAMSDAVADALDWIRIEQVNPLSPGGVALMFTLELER